MSSLKIKRFAGCIAAAMVVVLLAASTAQADITVLASGNDITAAVVADIDSRGFAITSVDPTLLDATITANPTLAGFQSVWLGWATTYALSAGSQADLAA